MAEEYKSTLSGRSGGSGRYSYRQASIGARSVRVAHMPEDDFKIRVTLQTNGEDSVPIIKMDTHSAQCLWAALNEMAKDLSWSDRLTGELLKERA